MSARAPAYSITELDKLVDMLPPDDRARFERIFHLSVATGQAVPPAAMRDWVIEHFGSLDAACQQRVVKITNRFILEGTLFNALRARRPIQAPPASNNSQDRIRDRQGCDFCQPRETTPADIFGRIEGRHSVSASNVAKYDGWHGVIVFDEHHPLRFTAEEVADYVDTAQQWAQRAHQADPTAQYPFFLWNCLWRSGASILHGHAQMVLTSGMHYAKVEGWRQAAVRYREAFGANYFADLITVHRTLGLTVDHGAAAVLPSLTPFKEKETLIIAECLDDDLKSALYRVLRIYVERLGVQSFNLVLYQPPFSSPARDWDGFPFIFRILDRGNLNSNTSDVGAMEFFAQSVVATDPFRLIEALQTGFQEEIL
jgi:galactose-1-phosphate uridylyltransferase